MIEEFLLLNALIACVVTGYVAADEDKTLRARLFILINGLFLFLGVIVLLVMR